MSPFMTSSSSLRIVRPLQNFVIWRAPQNRFVVTDIKIRFCMWKVVLKPFFPVTSNDHPKIIFIFTKHSSHCVPIFLYDRVEFSSKFAHKWKVTTFWHHSFFEVTKLERFHDLAGYQEAKNCERIDETKKIGHTHWVPQFSSSILKFTRSVEIIISTIEAHFCFLTMNLLVKNKLLR